MVISNLLPQLLPKSFFLTFKMSKNKEKKLNSTFAGGKHFKLFIIWERPILILSNCLFFLLTKKFDKNLKITHWNLSGIIGEEKFLNDWFRESHNGGIVIIFAELSFFFQSTNCPWRKNLCLTVQSYIKQEAYMTKMTLLQAY